MIYFSVLLAQSQTIQVDPRGLGFEIPDFGTVLTFLIKGFFVVAGIVALFYLLLGALAWITSGGSKENVDKARQKIQSAVVGIILVVVVLSVIVTLEQIVFQRAICFGISCPITIPPLIRNTNPTTQNTNTQAPATSNSVVTTPGGNGGYVSTDGNTNNTQVVVGDNITTPTPTITPTPAMVNATNGGALDFILRNQPTVTPVPKK